MERVALCAVLGLIVGLIGVVFVKIGEERLTRNTGVSFKVIAQPADQAIAEADRLGHLWLKTREWRALARQAYARGDARRALRLLDLALSEARLAINQAYVERARYWLARHGLNEKSPVAGALRAAVAARNGKAAAGLLHGLTEE